MFASLYSLLWFAIMTLAVYGLGRPLAVGLGIHTRDALARTIWSFAIGLLAVGVTLMGLGMAGLLYAPVIMGLTLGVAAEGCRRVATAACRAWSAHIARGRLQPSPAVVLPPPEKTASRMLRTDRSHQTARHPDEYPRAAPPGRRLALLLAILATAAIGGALVSGLAPPTAGDALCYHLELPKVFLNEHAIRYARDCENSAYPLLTEMWFLWGLAVEGPVTAQLMHWMLGLLLAGGGYVLAEPFLGRPWARSVALLVLLAPGVTNQMTAPLNDVALAAFCTLALAAWWQALDDQETYWALIAGLMLGAALSIKHTGLVFAAAVAVPSLWCLVRRSPDRTGWKLAAVTAVVAISIAGTWYVRAAWHTGDPVYPFLSRGESEGEGALALGHIAPARKRPLGFNPSDVISAPWQLTMTPELFGGRGHQLGAIFLAALPGLWLTRRLRGLGWLLAIAGLYAALWYCLRQNVRFLFPLIPLALIPTAWVWAESSRFHLAPRFLVACLLLTLATSGAAASALRCRGHWAVALGLESREQYLSREEPTYRFARLVNERLPLGARICSQEQRAFYFERPLVRERMYRERTQYHLAIDTPLALTQRLRRDGFSHMLLMERANDAGDNTLSELVRSLESQGFHTPWREVAAGDGRDPEGNLRHYRLLRLDEPHSTAARAATIIR